MNNGSSTKNNLLLVGLAMNSLSEKLMWVAGHIRNK